METQTLGHFTICHLLIVTMIVMALASPRWLRR
jgi:hypothetical protein